jgi:TonB family protein
MADQSDDFRGAVSEFWPAVWRFLHHWRFAVLSFGAALSLGLVASLLWVRGHPLSQVPAATEAATLADPVHKPLPAPMSGDSTHLPMPPPEIGSSSGESVAVPSAAADANPAPAAASDAGAEANSAAMDSSSSSSPPADTSPADADRGPRVLERTQPAYPADALSAHAEGEVRLQIQIDAQGKVSEVRIAANSGSDSLDRAALNAVRNWRYQPGTHDGQPIGGTIVVSVDFRIPDQH